MAAVRKTRKYFSCLHRVLVHTSCMTRIKDLEANLAVFQIKLSAKDLAELDAAAKIPVGGRYSEALDRFSWDQCHKQQ